MGGNNIERVLKTSVFGVKVMSSPPSGLLTVDDVTSYKNRVVLAHARMHALGHGAQRACADYSNEAYATVSRVVNGVFVDEIILTKIEEWLDLIDEAQKK